jgi:hypothetical protein
MAYLGNAPTSVPLSSADILDGAITSAKIADGTIVNADINASAGIVSTKLSGVQGKFESALLHVRDEKASGTSGGTFTSGAWQTRTLNTSMTNEISGASLSSNQITLPSGTYFINALAVALKVDGHKAKLRNITDSSDTLIGTSEYSGAGGVVTSSSIINGRFTIASQKTFEIQHRCDLTSSTNGFGQAQAFSVVEVFADVRIWKVA